ncbi:hypothetical protein ACV3RY_14960 [Clostridium perfringens]
MKLTNVPFNINAGVKVRLTEDARLHLDNDLARYGAKVVLDEEGYFNGPLRWMVNTLTPLILKDFYSIREIVFEEMDIKIPNEIIKEDIDSIRNSFDGNFKRFNDITCKYMVNIETFELLAKVCTYYGYTINDLKEKLIKKEDMRKFEIVFEELSNKKR